MDRHVVEESFYRSIFSLRPFKRLEVELRMMIFVADAINDEEFLILKTAARSVANVTGTNVRRYQHH